MRCGLGLLILFTVSERQKYGLFGIFSTLSEEGACKVLEFGERCGKEPGTRSEVVSAVLALIAQGMIIRFLRVNKNAGEHLS